ncbi:hypothetical protein BGZ79_002180 [Entomortierella chlamydospora]|nr:hypothetical protein BGZ79_002180 [Entomortierella chlamydospora]
MMHQKQQAQHAVYDGDCSSPKNYSNLPKIIRMAVELSYELRKRPKDMWALLTKTSSVVPFEYTGRFSKPKIEIP